MADVRYVWEKVALTVESLCGGAGTFDERMADAYLSQLVRLNSGDPPAEIADELNDVLRTVESHIGGGHIAGFTEDERYMIAKHLVHILIVTSRMTKRD